MLERIVEVEIGFEGFERCGELKGVFFLKCSAFLVRLCLARFYNRY